MQESTQRKMTIGMTILLVLIGLAMLLLMSSCGSGKYTERYKDAERSGNSNSDPADTITFPDGFSNVATKCDHGNRVYVLFHEDSPYGGLSVVPNAEGC